MEALERLTTDAREQRANSTAMTHNEYAFVRPLIEKSLGKDVATSDDLTKRFTALRCGVRVHHHVMFDPGD